MTAPFTVATMVSAVGRAMRARNERREIRSVSKQRSSMRKSASMSSAVALRVVAPVIFWPLQRDRSDPVEHQQLAYSRQKTSARTVAKLWVLFAVQAVPYSLANSTNDCIIEGYPH